MNAKLSTIAAALVLSATGAAFAGDITIDPTPFVPSLSRAEVQSQLDQYKASGVNPWSMRYNQLAGFQSAQSRDDVTAAYIASRDEVAALGREDSGSAYLAAHAPRTAPSSFATAAAEAQ